MSSLYRKLAFINMKNNKQFYDPYLLTGAMSAMMFYTMSAIRSNPGLDNTHGSNNLKTILPLVTAAIHLSAAFPLLNRLLAMFGLFNRTLFAGCLAGTLLAFGVIYFLVFRVTANSYYKIVGEQF